MAQNESSEARPSLVRLGSGKDYLADEPFARVPRVSTVHRDPNWELRRQGIIDNERHRELVREALEKGLSEELGRSPDITILDGERRIVVRTPPEKIEWKFRFAQKGRVGIGTGDGKSKKGDVIATDGEKGAGRGMGGIGDDGDVEYDESEAIIRPYLERVFSELELPLTNRASEHLTSPDDVKFTDRRKAGIFANLDKKATIFENIKRNAAKGDPHFHDIKNQDLRFKSWEEKPKPIQAVVIAMMDVSGSMGEHEQEAAKAILALQYHFLKAKYPQVQIVFIAHADNAQEFDTPEEFFRVSGGLGGGTKAVTAFALANSIIDDRFKPEEFDIFPMYVGDGDDVNLFADIRAEEARKLIDRSVQFGFAETVPEQAVHSTLRRALVDVAAENGERQQKLVATRLADSSEALRVLREMYPKGGRRNRK